MRVTLIRDKLNVGLCLPQCLLFAIFVEEKLEDENGVEDGKTKQIR